MRTSPRLRNGISRDSQRRCCRSSIPIPTKPSRFATEVIEPFIARFDARFLEGMRHKIGLASALQDDAELVNRLLATMKDAEADFTLTFRRLALAAERPGNETPLRELFAASCGIDNWLRDWRQRVARDPQSVAERVASMRRVNAAFIPRNHRVETALTSASEGGDFQPFHQLLAILQRPYDDQPEADAYGRPPQPSERVLQTFCGT